MPDTHAINRLVSDWIKLRIDADAWNWLRAQEEQIAGGGKQSLFLAFSLIPRKIGKADAALTREEMQQAQLARPGWVPVNWSVDQLARAWVLLNFPCSSDANYAATVDTLFTVADVREHVALLRALPLLPKQSLYKERALEAVRSNMTPVLEAIMFDNAFPCEQFSTHEWNRMVLKALFLDLAIEKVMGLGERHNPELERMAIDLARERRSAGRPIPERLHLIASEETVHRQHQPYQTNPSPGTRA
jgi:hypothetical protein